MGFVLKRVLEEAGAWCSCPSSAVLDLRNPKTIKACIQNCHPDVVLHCAAYTDVDGAELHPAQAEVVNVEGTRHIAELCGRIHAKMVYISTDYVFSGTGTAPYEIDSPTGPVNIYGRTKLAGELAVRRALDEHFILRTSWLFGVHGDNFVEKLLRRAAGRASVEVVQDQIGSPTCAEDLAPKIMEICLSGCYGTYHVTGEGDCTRAEFAREIFRQMGMNTEVLEVPTAEFPSVAQRPLYCALSRRALDERGFARLSRWEEGLSRYLRTRSALKHGSMGMGGRSV